MATGVRGSARIGAHVGGHYSILRLLGLGGSASVYEAEDLASGEMVVLKVPHDTRRPNSIGARRLLREARVSNAVQHPNLCHVLETGTLPDGAPFAVLERLVGETLRDRITKERYLPFADILDIMMQVLSGLGAAHERGILHRDVKPENIFLTQRAGGTDLVKILDFGLVTSTQPEREELTDLGTVVGTPCYMSPEQIRGVRDFDVRVDLYACGVVLYEATAGRRPFASPDQGELFRQIIAASPTPIPRLRPDTPTRLVEIIAKAMSPSPMCRFASASAFQRALSGVQVA